MEAALHARLFRLRRLEAAVARVHIAFQHQLGVGQRVGVHRAALHEADRRTLYGARNADLVAAHGQDGVVEARSREQRAGRRHAEAHADRDRLILLVVFVGHLPHVRAGRNLERAHIAPAEIHAVVAEVGAAIELVEADAADAGADGQLGLVYGVPDRHHVRVDVLRIEHDVLLHRRVGLGDDLGLERLAERRRDMTGARDVILPAKHLVDDVHVAEQVGDHPVVRLALDVVEHHRAAAVHVLLQAGDLKVRVDRLVGLDQIALCTQPFQRGAKIAGAGVGESAFMRRGRCGGLLLGHRLLHFLMLLRVWLGRNMTGLGPAWKALNAWQHCRPDGAAHRAA